MKSATTELDSGQCEYLAHLEGALKDAGIEVRENNDLSGPFPLTLVWANSNNAPVCRAGTEYCEACKGAGELMLPVHTYDPQDGYDAMQCCPECEGTGEPQALTVAQCVAIYDAVWRSGLARNVKTPPMKVDVVRSALIDQQGGRANG